jgi:hypothetical protein
MRILKAAFLYFTIVFGVGFVLGTIRTLWILPKVGTRTAELMELPIMFIVTIFAARFAVRHLPTSGRAARLTMGCTALVLMLAAEFGFVLWLRGIGIRQYLATRDPVAGTAYYVMLVIFALIPAAMGRTGSATE